MAEEQSEATATLRIVVMSAVGLKDIRFLGKMKSFAVAWMDPRLKRTTKTLTSSSTSPNWNYELSFPLSLQTLRNPNSCITIQILSSSTPVHRQRVIGSTALPLSDVRYEEEIFALQLWRPSGRAQGLLKVSSRIEYHYHHHHDQEEHSYAEFDCVTGIPVESLATSSSIQLQPVDHDRRVFPGEFRSSSHVNAVPSAPPLPEESEPEPPMPEAEAKELPIPEKPNDRLESANKSNDALRSVLIGFLGGAIAVATVLIGGGTANG